MEGLGGGFPQAKISRGCNLELLTVILFELTFISARFSVCSKHFFGGKTPDMGVAWQGLFTTLCDMRL